MTAEIIQLRHIANVPIPPHFLKVEEYVATIEHTVANWFGLDAAAAVQKRMYDAGDQSFQQLPGHIQREVYRLLSDTYRVPEPILSSFKPYAS